MAVKVGFPRGLWYYDYYPLWKSFYESLGAEVISSDPTNKQILEEGVKNTVEEACLPVKIFHGHVLNLKDRVDYIFIPKLMSVYNKEYICPKFCGLPEMIKHAISGLPHVIETEINFNQSRRNLAQTVYSLGAPITKNPIKIKRAYDNALLAYKSYKAKLNNGYFPMDGLLKECSTQYYCQDPGNSLKIALLGHSYNVYDSYSSMDLIKKLLKKKASIIVPEMLGYDKINLCAARLEKKMFWSYGRKLLGSAIYLSEKKSVDGVIYLSSFGCGIDSIVAYLAERSIHKDAGIPFLLLTIDEHTGEAGVNTRIEAFIDMIEWRKKSEGNVSTYG
jgi:predicted nucleotide-binding protein (sugar kinase/HSP70/actin superfamily)